MCIGARDWFRLPAERSVTLHSLPAQTIAMPETATEVGETFRAVSEHLAEAGFRTGDAG